MKKFVKENYVYAIFCIVLIIINMFYMNNIFPENDKLSNMSTIVIAQIIVFILELVFCVIIRILSKKKFKLENIFLILAIPLGILYLVGIPMGSNPDEYNHFSRVYEISRGQLITELNDNNDAGALAPIEIVENSLKTAETKYSDIIESIKTPNSGEKVFHGFYNTALYSFVSYLPIIIGVFIGRILNSPIVLTGYLGRICNLISWIVIMYFAIKKLPYFKEFLMFIALIPITIAEATAITADGFTFAMSCLFISYIFSLMYKKEEKISLKDNIILLSLTIIISLCKIVYLPLCLLLLLIPNEKYDSKKKKYITNIGIILISVIINLIWLKIASRFLVKLNPGVNSHDQLIYILSNPFRYLQILFNSLSSECEAYIFSMFGRSVAGTGATSTIYLFACICIFVNLILKTKENKSSYFEKLLVILIMIAITGLMFTSLYMQWTPVGNSKVDGVQGRYFLPYISLLPFAFFAIKPNKKEEVNEESNSMIIRKEKINIDYITVFMVLYNIYMYIEIFSKFI